MAKLLQRYLSFDGRLARLPFFARGIAIGITAAVIGVAGVPLVTTDTRVGYWAGVVVAIAAIALLVIGNVSLTVRRLHDLGLSGYHAIWVSTAQAGSYSLSHGPPKALLLGLPMTAIGLWLLFWPGNKIANRFGEAG